MINGFGLERIGLTALRFPVISSVLIAAFTLLTLFGATRLEFSGANVDILRDNSVEIANYDTLLTNFRDFNNDAIVLIRSDRLATVEGIETYRDIHFEFQFSERVESVLSMFSLVQYEESEGGWSSAVPAEFESDEEVRQFLLKIAQEIPNSQSLLGPDLDSAVMVVYVKAGEVDDKRIRETIEEFETLAKEYEKEGIDITIAGQPAIRSGLIYNIIQDLVLLVPLAALFCGLLGWIIFKSFWSMVLCSLPTVVSSIWFLGALGLLGIHLNFLTNILPVLLIVIIFADSLHLYIKWQNLCSQAPDPHAALTEAVRTVGPACALSTITTAIALMSLAVTGNFGLLELGVVGATGILGCFLAVIAVLPLGCYWAVRAGFVPSDQGASRLRMVARPAFSALKRKPVVIAGSAVLLAIGLYAHFAIDSRFRLIDYLASQSAVAQSEGFIDNKYPGSTPLFAIFDTDSSKPLLDPANTDPFYQVLDEVRTVFDSTSSYSLADFAQEVEKGGGEIKESDIDELPRYLTSRFIAEDKSKVLITIFSSANTSAKDMRIKLAELEQRLKEKGLSDRVTMTGYPILAGIVAPRLMDDLRTSLILAVTLAIGIIMVAARSVRIGLACILPNLLPILCVEIVLWLLGIPLNMSITVALTVAFGIAVDDSIHMVNQYMMDSEAGASRQSAVKSALKEVTPALVSTTLILSGGMTIMLFSTLPAIAVFALVVILTLIFALLCDIFLLPASLHTLR